jgi:nucleoside-diphosphate-sugar epimerase
MPVQGQKFVIIGGAGLIGSALAHSLIAEHTAEVVICDQFGAVDGGKWARIPVAIDDIWTPDCLATNLDKAWREIAGVVYLADGGHANNDCDAIFQSAFHLPRSVWDFCVAKQRPLQWASSSHVYGSGPSDLSTAPSDIAKLSPLTAFGRAKLAFDMFAARQGTGPNAPPVWSGFRLSSVYGKGEHHKDDIASLPVRAMAAARTGGTLELDRDLTRDWVHVDDCAAALAGLVTGAHAGFYDIGSGIETSGSQLVAQIEAVTGQKLTTINATSDGRAVPVPLPPANIGPLVDAGISVQFRSLAQGLTTL